MSGIILQVRENGSTGAWTTLTLDENGCADVSTLTVGTAYDYRLVTEDQTPSPRIYKEGDFTKLADGAVKLAQDYGGALFALDDGQLFQDRSVTPSTSASIGDEVGTIVGLDGTWVAIAPSDAERATLREDETGKRYLEGVENGQRFLVQDVSGNPFVLGAPSEHFAAVAALDGNNSLTFGTNYRHAWTLGNPNFFFTVRNGANSRQIVLLRYGSTGAISIISRWYKEDPSALLDGFDEFQHETTGTVIGMPGQLALMSQRNDMAGDAPSRFYGACVIPSVSVSLAEDATIRQFLGSRIYPPLTPTDTNDIEINFAVGQYEWGGVTRALTDLTDNGDGTYTLDFVDWLGGAYVVSVDYEVPDWSVPADFTRLVEIEDEGGTHGLHLRQADNLHYHNYFDAPGSPTNRILGVGSGQGKTQQGLMRATFYYEPGKRTLAWHQGSMSELQFPAQHFNRAVGLFVNRTFAGGSSTLIRARGGVMSRNDVVRFHSNGVGEPVHLLGDSFVVFGVGSEQALRNVTSDLGYLFVSGDGVGGSTLPEQRDRFVAYTGDEQQIYDRTLIIEDGGWGYDSQRDDIGAINEIFGLLTHSRRIYHAPWMNETQGSATASGIDFRSGQDAIAAAIGDAYLESATAAQAAHNDSTESINEVHAGLIPRGPEGNRDSRTDSVHPTPKGYEIRARCARARLIQKGWLTGPAVTAPGAPSNFAATGLDLSWDMPSDDGGDPVRSWTVSVEDSPGAGTFSDIYTGQVRRHTLSGLATGTWKVRVIAANTVGTGVHSEIDVVVP